LAACRIGKVWLEPDAGDFELFKAQTARRADPADWPLAAEIVRNVLIYDGDRVRHAAGEERERRALTAEWVEAFASGPGVIVIRNAMPDLAVVDRATEIFDAIIDEQHRTGGGGADHFAKPGANDRIWNSLEKHCLADPQNFLRYYASDAIALASQAWLGRGYQMTAQVNRVNPGGAAQSAHRDYHLGFMSADAARDFPAHVHSISPVLTLQGAVAHCDMPVETGPTMYLPYSQHFFEGYIAFGRPEFQEHFARHHVQLPLAKGDAAFFNPALMHGAGHNRTADVRRMANLLQVSSAMGRAMETVDRARMTKALYPALLAAAQSGSVSARGVANAIAASAEGYSFPTNLDRDPPIGGLAPKTQAQIVREALAAGMGPVDLAAAVDALTERQKA